MFEYRKRDVMGSSPASRMSRLLIRTRARGGGGSSGGGGEPQPRSPSTARAKKRGS